VYCDFFGNICLIDIGGGLFCFEDSVGNRQGSVLWEHETLCCFVCNKILFCLKRQNIVLNRQHCLVQNIVLCETMCVQFFLEHSVEDRPMMVFIGGFIFEELVCILHVS